MSNDRVHDILRSLGSKNQWFGGPTPAGSLRSVNLDLALRKLSGLKHCIWELALHIAYWEYAVSRTLVNGPKGGFPRTPSNWPALPEEPSDRLWKADREPVRQERQSLISVVEGLEAAKLSERVSAQSQRTVGELLVGIVQHSVYHTGQIALLKRLE